MHALYDEGSLPEKALSDSPKLASTLYFFVNRSVHVLYPEICILSGNLRSVDGIVPEGSRNSLVCV